MGFLMHVCSSHGVLRAWHGTWLVQYGSLGAEPALAGNQGAVWGCSAVVDVLALFTDTVTIVDEVARSHQWLPRRPAVLPPSLQPMPEASALLADRASSASDPRSTRRST